MNISNTTLHLPEGNFLAKTIAFDEFDRQYLKETYGLWRELTEKLHNIQGRGINLPEALSESAFCLEMNAVRVPENIQGAKSSFDCYQTENNRRIQIKACSVLPDLTSFGPKSVWDDLYFLDFLRGGQWDGSFDIYLIDNELIYNHPVNSDETLWDQQQQGRRPRFSIYRDIIEPNHIMPIKTGRIWK